MLHQKNDSTALLALFFVPVRFGEQVRLASGNKKCPRSMSEGTVILLLAERGKRTLFSMNL